MGKNRNPIKKREGKVKEMVTIDNVVTPSSYQMHFMTYAMMYAYGLENTVGQCSGLGCSERNYRGEIEKGNKLCVQCIDDMINTTCHGIGKHYILCESDKELLLRDKVGFMSYMMVYFTITGPLDFIRDFVNFDLFLDGCDDIFHTILMPHFIKRESVNDAGNIYRECHVMINYSALSNMYMVYKDSEEENWQWICKWIESSLPYSDLITSRSRN